MSEVVSVPVTISILEKDYVVSCPPGEEDALRESARVLGERMAQAREAGRTLGTERVAVVTALNIIHEFLSMDRERRQANDVMLGDIERMEHKIANSLSRRSGADGVD